MTKLIKIVILFAFLSLMCIQVAQATSPDDKNLGFLRGQEHERRLSWSSFIKTLQNDAKAVANVLKGATSGLTGAL